MHFEREKALEGKYLIQTGEPQLGAVEAVRTLTRASRNRTRHRNRRGTRVLAADSRLGGLKNGGRTERCRCKS